MVILCMYYVYSLCDIGDLLYYIICNVDYIILYAGVIYLLHSSHLPYEIISIYIKGIVIQTIECLLRGFMPNLCN